MHDSVGRSESFGRLPPLALEVGLLELFAPSPGPEQARQPSIPGDHRQLWRVDAIHRAKNMAQLSTALAAVVDNPSRRWLPAQIIEQAKCLSRAYEELGVDDGTQKSVPCATLLTEIATRLTNIFGQSRKIVINVSAQPVMLPPDARRALVLMASELVINALKYGYPTDAGGTISVSLTATHAQIQLIVQDDGVGIVETYSAGHGGGLLDQLRAALGAQMLRSTHGDGHGFQITISIPIEIVETGTF